MDDVRCEYDEAFANQETLVGSDKKTDDSVEKLAEKVRDLYESLLLTLRYSEKTHGGAEVTQNIGTLRNEHEFFWIDLMADRKDWRSKHKDFVKNYIVKYRWRVHQLFVSVAQIRTDVIAKYGENTETAMRIEEIETDYFALLSMLGGVIN